ncbi:MAG: hypothetical protein E6J58_01565 [Deltaproteobacteria bacterium]|nr:MAG: hypothetical protein E6J58_01565 [Deltaproteobacteria bacterium]
MAEIPAIRARKAAGMRASTRSGRASAGASDAFQLVDEDFVHLAFARDRHHADVRRRRHLSVPPGREQRVADQLEVRDGPPCVFLGQIGAQREVLAFEFQPQLGIRGSELARASYGEQREEDSRTHICTVNQTAAFPEQPPRW